MTPGQSSDLKAALAQRGPLNPRDAVDVVRHIAVAIDGAHRRQRGQRTVTTETILVSRPPAGDANPRLTAHLADSDTGAAPSADRTRVFVTDPELTHRAEIAALAGVLYECLTGSAPSTPPQRPSQLRPGIPAGLDEVIARGMADDPAGGYRSAADFAAAAESALVQQPGSAAPAPSSASTRVDAAVPDPAGATQTIHLPPTGAPPRAPGDPHSGRVPTNDPPAGYPPRVPGPPPPNRRRRRAVIIAVAIAVVVAVDATAAVVIPRLTRHRATTAAPAAPTPPPRRNYTSVPMALPFPGLDRLKSVAVDAAGNVYVLAALSGTNPENAFDPMQSKVFKLPPGASATTVVEVPSVDMRMTTDMAVDGAGNIFISDRRRVWELPVGASSPIRLPFRGFVSIEAIAVDSAGNTYAAGPLSGGDTRNLRYGVKKLVSGDARPADLGFKDVYQPHGIAVDKAGNVYVCSSIKGKGKGRIQKLAAGAAEATELPITDTREPVHLTVDAAGNIWIADDFTRGVFELEAGASSPRNLPLDAVPTSVAVDPAGNVYLTARATRERSTEQLIKPGQVLKLRPDR